MPLRNKQKRAVALGTAEILMSELRHVPISRHRAALCESISDSGIGALSALKLSEWETPRRVLSFAPARAIFLGLAPATGNSNPELLHARLQRGSFHPEQRRGALRSGYSPVGLLQSRDDLLALRLFEYAAHVFWISETMDISRVLLQLRGLLMKELESSSRREELSKTGPCDTMTARSITFCNSRMLPGHWYRTSAFIVSEGIVSIFRLVRRLYCWTKWRTSRGISSGRSRSAGTRTGKTFRR